MDERERDRIARLEARNARRRAKGQPTWDFDEYPPGYGAGAAESAPSLADPDQPTMVITAAQLRQAESGDESRRRLAVSTAIFGIATALSRVLGLVREMVAGYYFGVGGRINAFTVAFQVPNLFRALVADAALSSAFVPVFSDLLEK
ncbi:MAG TPA: lipid II flippase MurJ, partial [Gaiellaceae bacterium]|nr:lipid II flippase MurJ [Gaiellaceae bacterium]